MDISKYHFIVTNHAMVRLKQRFYGKFKSYFAHPEMTKNLIIGQITTGDFMQEWKMVPFIVNREASLYDGANIEIVKKSGVYYLCIVDHEKRKVIVKTACDRFHFYR